MIVLPDGFAARAPAPGDAAAVTALAAACEIHDDGLSEIDLDDVRSHWMRPGFDLSADAVAVVRGAAIVAAAEIYQGRADADVHPDWRGRGLGSALMRWTWDRAREHGRSEVGQTLPDVRADAVALLRAHGYTSRWTSWILSADLTRGLDPPDRLPGYTIRGYRSSDERAVYDVIEAAFREWPDREPTSFEGWRAITTARESFAPAMTVVVESRGRIVGAAIGLDYGGSEAWIHQVAVDRAHRGRGIASAMLVESFRLARAAGRTAAGLSTDSRTGALPLYERAGMRVRRSYTRWTKRL